jgi:flagellar motility protein MotE (MotC chaperone)
MKNLKLITLTLICNLIAVSGAFADEALETKVYPTPQNVSFEVSKTDFSENEIMLLQSLEAKRIEIERKSQVLMIREKLIDLSEIKLEDKIKTLKNLEVSLNALLKEVSEKEEKRLQDLSIVYSEMKPALAAERLNILDDNTVYGVLKRMNFKNSAKVLEKMDIQKVSIISKMLAQKAILPNIN